MDFRHGFYFSYVPLQLILTSVNCISTLYNCFGDPVINSKHKFNYLISVVFTILYRFRHCIDSLRKIITLTSSRLWKRTFISIINLRGDTAFQCIWNIEIFRPLTERGISFHSFLLVDPEGHDPPTFWLWVSCSNQLSYGSAIYIFYSIKELSQYKYNKKFWNFQIIFIIFLLFLSVRMDSNHQSHYHRRSLQLIIPVLLSW